MAGTRTSIAEQLANAAVGTEVEPRRQTVRPQSSAPSPRSSVPQAESSQVNGSRQEDEKTNSLPDLPAVTLFSPPTSTDPAERLAYCTGAIQDADRRTELATERITQQYLLWVGEPYRIVRDEELYRVAGYSTFDKWGRALNGRSGDYMNKIIRVAPVVRALSPITRRQLKEQPLRPLVAVQREHGDEAVRRCWRKAEAAGDLTERGLRAAAVECGYAIAPEPEPLEEVKPQPELEPSDVLRLKKLQRLAASDPQRALALCRQAQSDLARLEQDLLTRPTPGGTPTDD
ncbi:hypothetical protein SAMN04490357_0013 [Streptomyces misionensis]|uniref:Uncharacterized protein n=1 Tax=Streptomyces misionensis TaxID=67331 RepID=A0A1H4I853_9ACTN|nr:hypothetical protein [Streptomyces misionensis]SEB29538.1 hypothetical protein SAMN04490357_0013 [Streptomyces misionensis]